MKKTFLIMSVVAVLAIAVVSVLADKQMPAAKVSSGATAVVGEMAPDFALMDAAGKKHALTDYKGKFVVLEWINFGCPFVVKHYGSGNMQSLQSGYEKKGVVWLTICSSAPGKQGYLEGAELTAAIAEHGCKSTAYLVDADGSVGRMYNAKATPNMYVIDPSGKLIYAGAIDDKPTTNTDDIKSATNYVQAALDAAMTGKPVEVSSTQPYGCSVKY